MVSISGIKVEKSSLTFRLQKAKKGAEKIQNRTTVSALYLTGTAN